jgi:hypothetical protein
MRARIRTIKPETALDEQLWDLAQSTGLPAFQAFTMLWCHADREGRFEWRPRALKTLILPYWEGDMGALLDAMAEAGFLVRYEVDGKVYGLVKNFHKHQSPNVREPASTLPGPADAATCKHVHDTADSAGDSDESNEVVDTLEENETTETRIVPHVQTCAPRASSSSSLPFPVPKGGAGGSLRERAAHLVRDPVAHTFDDPLKWPEVQQAFAVFREVWGKKRWMDVTTGMKDPRLRVVVERLADGVTAEQIVRALRGSKRSENIKKTREWQTLQTLLRDVGQVEKFGDLLDAPEPASQALKQPSSNYRSERTVRG